ncbi:ATP-binding cassette domain-containing protein [candidate division GN15 bacterium]|nr:ATP-binding cassette domain-containing protein [candidate division GN15 bacterium]
MTDSKLLECRDVSFAYGDQPILDNVNLILPTDEFIWIVGPNGGGKTTLLKLILGLLEPDTGRIEVLGHSPQAARHLIGYMPQYAQYDSSFPATVLDVVKMGTVTTLPGHRSASSSPIDRAHKALDQVGLSDLADRSFSRLSGGQMRRLFIARALASEPKLLVLDEPTANLDIKVEEETYELLRGLSEHLSILMVSHQPAFVSRFVEHVVCVNRRVSLHPTAEVDGDFLKDFYGRSVRLVRHDRHVHEDGEND